MWVLMPLWFGALVLFVRALPPPAGLEPVMNLG